MVLASVREPRLGAYILQDVCICPGPLDTILLRKAWNQVASRHAALRTSIALNAAGQAIPHVEATPDYTFRELDWSQSSAEETERELAALLEDDRREGFDFRNGVPLRLLLIRTSPDCHALVLTAHHALLDGRSLIAVWREWFEVYEALVEGRAPALPVVPPFSEHSAQGAQHFWKGYLAGLQSTTGFITDRLKPAAPPASQRYTNYRCSLGPEPAAGLRDFARAHGVSLATLVNAAWAILLSRYSGRKDVVFGVTRSGRGPGREDAVGLLINTLPVRIHVEPGAPLALWLEQIRRDSLAMREYETTSVEEAIEWGGLPSGAPPFDSVVVYDHEPPQETLRRLGGNWNQRTLRRFQRTDLPLVLGSYGEPVLSLNIGYDTNLYCEATVAAMAGHLQTILASMCSHPDSRLADIGMLTDAEKELLLRPRTLEIDPSLCAHDLFEAQVRRTPGHPALEVGDEIITYDDLNRRANRLASLLRQRRVGLEDLVAVSLPHIRDTIVALFAILKAGGAFIAIDPATPAERRAIMLAETRPKFILDENTDLAGLPEQSDSELPSLANSGNAAYAVFTSGSTGKAKAIVVTHGALVNHTLAVAPAYEITPADRRLQFAALASDVFVAETFNYLTAGATIVICPDARKSSLQQFHRLIDEERITITAVPGSWWNTWVAALSAGSVRLPGSLRAVVVGMERADPAVFHAWRQVAGNRLRWFNAYGPAENSPTSTLYEAGTSRWECAAMLPIGKPIANTTAYVVDDDGGLLPAGLTGELYVGGSGLARGYLGAPELTSSRFMDDPFQAGGRVYRTGDRAFALPDGNLVFAGRVDRQVKVRGYRVELDEIEESLARHPAVSQCAVVAAGDLSQQRLAAYFTGGASEQDLRLHLARLLPEYMIPTAWMRLDRLPLTPTGKIDRLALPPCEPSPQAGSIDSPPSTHSEQRLAVLWREVLGVPEVSVLDDFFRLGGDSLSATRLLLGVQDEFGIELSMAALVQTPTLARLAARLDAGGESDGLIALEPRGSLPPFVCVTTTVAGPWCLGALARSLGKDQPFYLVPHLVAGDRSDNAVPGLAELTAAAIRANLPEGPYTIGGYCFGGVVAYETAQLLAASGAEVRMVVLFDAAAPGYPKLLASGLNYLRHFGRMLRGGVNGSHTARPSEIGAHASTVGSLLRRKVAARYKPRPAQFPVVQFIAAEEQISTRVLADPRLGWRDLCRGQFHLHHIGGTHGSLFDEECAVRIAGILRPLLARR